MWQHPRRNRHRRTAEEEEEKGEEEGEEQKQNRFCLCAHLILPWLTPLELANTSLTCKTVLNISKSITRHRSLDASRSLENLPVPFHNTLDNIPYAYFIYTPCQIFASSSSSSSSSSLQSPQSQFWGPSPRPGLVFGSGLVSAIDDDLGSKSTELNRLEIGSVSVVDESGESLSGCECEEECLEVGDVADQIYGCPCFSGLEELGIVNECGPTCGCGLECGNRATQRGVSVRLKIVRVVNKGWGLFADQPIRQGQFICQYAGI